MSPIEETDLSQRISALEKRIRDLTALVTSVTGTFITLYLFRSLSSGLPAAWGISQWWADGFAGAIGLLAAVGFVKSFIRN